MRDLALILGALADPTRLEMLALLLRHDELCVCDFVGTHRDTQPSEVAPLLAKRKLVAVPAVYLLDGAGEVLDVMQGELTDKELAAALK